MAYSFSKTKIFQKGFTLLELMLSVAIVTILATVSYGYYQQNIAQANITDLVLRIDAMRTAFSVQESVGGIPNFRRARPGVVPPALRQMAITDDDLKYPRLDLALVMIGLRGGPRMPYLQVSARRNRGTVEITALSNDLAEGQFAWLAEPVLALVPMIGSLPFDGNQVFPPQSTGNVSPVPVSTVTTSVPNVAIVPTSPWQSPAKLVDAKDNLVVLNTLVNGSALRIDQRSRSELVQHLQDTLTQINNDDPDKAGLAISAFEQGVNDLMQTDRSNQPFIDMLDLILTDARSISNDLYDATQPTP